MEITIADADKVTVVVVAGEIDGKTVALAQERIVPLCVEGSRVLLDMSQVTFMSSAGLRLMVLLHRQARAASTTMALAGLSEELRDIMSATGFLGQFTVYENVALGQAELNQ